MQLLTYLLAFAVGGFTTAYLTTNSLSASKVDGELPVIFSYFLVAAVTTLIALGIKDGGEGFAKFASLPWYGYLTGVAAGASLFFTTQLIGNIGPDKFFVCSVAGQLVISVGLAHFGWLGTEQEAVNWQKVAGVALAIGGAVLVSFKFE